MSGHPVRSLGDLRSSVQALADGGVDWLHITEGDLASLADDLATAKALTEAARTVQSQIEQACAKALEGTRGPVELPGIGTLQRRNGALRKSWDHQRLAPVVAQAAMAVYDADADGPMAEYVASKLVEAAGLSYWRVGVLRGFGLDPATYCDESYGQPTVQFVPASVQEDAA